MSTLGERLKNARIQRCFTQDQLANRLNVTRSTISNWERDISEPSYDRTTSYVFLQAIVVYTLKIIDYSDQVYISDAKQKPLYQAAQVLLSNYKVYSMAEKYSHLNEPSKLNIHDQRSQMEIYNLTTRLKFISNYDVQYTNEIFSRFSKNLDWDESFILSLMALPFHNMGTISFAAKKELIRKIRALIDEVIEQPKEEHKYDRYEFE